MRISKLRRTLAVFLSALMITLCVPLTAITASAATIHYNNLDVNDLISDGDVITYENPYSNTTVSITVYFIWKDKSADESNYAHRIYDEDTRNINITINGGLCTTTSNWKVVKLSGTTLSPILWLMSDQYQTFNITLDANGGTLPNSTTNPAKATNGKLTSTQLAITPTDRDDFNFLGLV